MLRKVKSLVQRGKHKSQPLQQESISQEETAKPSSAMDLIYSHLPSSSFVRLLELKSGSGEDAIRADLRPVNLQDKPEYEALSYVWGREPPNDSITVQDHAFATRPNLIAALRRLRLPNQPRVLWIDAICINQADVDERGQQVNLMREIYTNAKKVLIFMPADYASSTEAAWELGGRIAQVSMQYFGYGTEILEAPVALRLEAKNALEGSVGWKELMAATRRWLGNEWFQRVWTFQEAFLAKEAFVLCGEHELHFQAFLAMWSGMLRIGVRPDLNGIECSRVLMATCEWALSERLAGNGQLEPQQRARLSTLLRSTFRHKVTDDRDRVYGMLAMVDLADDARFRPDYRQSVKEAYTLVAKWLILDDGHLQILSDAQGLEHDPALPSWVPDWRGKMTVHRLAERTRDFERTFRVNGRFEPARILLPGDEPNKIKLRGMRLGKIVNAQCGTADLVRGMHHSMIQLSSWRSFVAAPRKMCDLFRKLGALPVPGTYAPTGEPAMEACIRTLAADELPCSPRMRRDVHEYYPAYADYSALSWRQAVQPLPQNVMTSGANSHASLDRPGGPAAEVTDLLFGRTPARPLALYPDLSIPARLVSEQILWNIAKDVCRAIETHAYGRVFIITDNGYLGIAPEEAETGDEVWTLAGGDVPFVLRRKSVPATTGSTPGSESNSGEVPEYSLIGDCYVHGILDGELWQEPTVSGQGNTVTPDNVAREPMPKEEAYCWETITLV
jgi:hypothetical protein